MSPQSYTQTIFKPKKSLLHFSIACFNMFRFSVNFHAGKLFAEFSNLGCRSKKWPSSPRRSGASHVTAVIYIYIYIYGAPIHTFPPFILHIPSTHTNICYIVVCVFVVLLPTAELLGEIIKFQQQRNFARFPYRNFSSTSLCYFHQLWHFCTCAQNSNAWVRTNASERKRNMYTASQSKQLHTFSFCQSKFALLHAVWYEFQNNFNKLILINFFLIFFERLLF